MADGPLGSFYQSVGINVRIEGTAPTYLFNKAKLEEIGIRHVRDHTGIQGITSIDSTVCERIRDLGRSGVLSTILWREFQSWDALVNTTASLVPFLDAVEGPNEPDFGPESFHYPSGTGPGFPEGVRNYQHDLYAAIKGDARTKSVPVMLSALMWSELYQNPYGANNLPGLGNMETFGGTKNMDFGTMHIYPYFDNYAPPGWNMLRDYHISYVRKAAPTLPLICSEGGYKGASEWAQSRYVPRWFLELFRAGIQRSFIWRLYWEDNSEGFNLVRPDGTNTPAFECVKNLLSIIRDPGPAFATDSLAFTLSGASLPESLHWLILQKRNGAFYLILWNDVQNYDGTKNLVHTDITIVLTFTTKIKKAFQYLPLESASAKSEVANPASLNISVPDHPLVLELQVAEQTATISDHKQKNLHGSKANVTTSKRRFDLRGSVIKTETRRGMGLKR